MELSNILNYNRDLIFQDTLLDAILSKISFKEFFNTIIQYPDVYESLSKKQDYWELYYKQHYDEKTYMKEEEINWFYEVIIQEYTTHLEIYYNSLYTRLNDLSTYIDNFEEIDPRDERTEFSIRNLLKMKDVKDVISNYHVGYYILYRNGDVYGDLSKQKLLQNINRMITNSTNIRIFFLSNDGLLYQIDRSRESLTRLVNLPFKVKNVQFEDNGNGTRGDNIMSFQDFNNNIYSGYSLGFERLLNVVVNNPLLKDFIVNSYSITYNGEEFAIDPNIPDPFFSIMYYVTTKGKLYKISYNKYQQQGNPELIETKDNVLVKNVWVKTLNFRRSKLDLDEFNTETFLIYQDLDNNIYIQNDNYPEHIKYYYSPDTYNRLISSNENKIYVNERFPKGIPRIIQFVVDNKDNVVHFTFITSNGEIIFIKFRKREFERNYFDRDLFEHEPEISVPINTKILHRNNNTTILRTLYKYNRVILPYSLYLLYLLKGLIITDSITNNIITFNLKESEYTFRTTIPEETK